MSTGFAATVGTDFNPDPENKVFDSLFKQYERVIFQSVITSFGLDLFIKDRLGGDVDTIHNVRQGEAGGGYKSTANKAAYDNRGAYNSAAYHTDEAYKRSNKQYSQQHADGTLMDAYIGKRIAPNEKYHQDHVISAKEVHEDAGRILSGLSGTDLANSPNNLKATNPRTNQTKNADSMDDFLGRRGDEYTEEQIERMKKIDSESREEYNQKINTAYYSSPEFWKNTGFAAAKAGTKMGLRQALGFVMTEVWFSVKEALTEAESDFAEKLKAIGNGIKRGFQRAKEKFKGLLSKFGEGAVSGMLASLTTTLCNIFFTTTKNIGRIIRQTWASIVEAVKILVFNPDRLTFAERMKAALKILAVGASVVLGTIVQEAVHKALTPYVGTLPVLGDTILDIVSIFSGTLCTGFLTVSMLYFIDSDPFGGFLTRPIDKTIAEYKRQAALFSAYAVELQKMDIATFEREADLFYSLASRLDTVTGDSELNQLLMGITRAIGISIPWDNDRSLDSFMNDKNAVLVFKA